jgi:hypothetical protein
MSVPGRRRPWTKSRTESARPKPATVAKSTEYVSILIDDERVPSSDTGECQIARTAKSGIALLEQHRGDTINCLYLDYNLGYMQPSIAAVLDYLVEAANSKRPFTIGVIVSISSGPSQSGLLMERLEAAGYHTERGYLGRNDEARYGIERCTQCHIVGQPNPLVPAMVTDGECALHMICDNGHRWGYSEDRCHTYQYL